MGGWYWVTSDDVHLIILSYSVDSWRLNNNILLNVYKDPTHTVWVLCTRYK